MSINHRKNKLIKVLPIIFAIFLTACGGNSEEEALKQENMKLSATIKELQSLLNKNDQKPQANTASIEKKLADVQTVLRKKNKVIQQKNQELEKLSKGCPE